MANYAKTILCFANSRKVSGRCVAGKEFDQGSIGEWVRPISAREVGELSFLERRYANGTDPGLLDIISIPMLEAKPHAFQTENHLIDPTEDWTLLGRGEWKHAQTALDDDLGPLWDNSSSGSYGTHDRVRVELADPAQGSLRLVEVADLRVIVGVEGEAFGNPKRKVRGQFSHSGVCHLLAITDPVMERKYLAGANGEFDVGHAIMCVSLGEPYVGYAYKLIAGVILPA